MAVTADQTRIASFALMPIAIIATLLRLFLRIKRRKLWWDDFFAFVSMFGIIVMWIGIIIFTSSEKHTRAIKVFGYYSVDNGFYATIWPARISILLTVIRLAMGQFRKLLKLMVVAFLITWAILDAQVWWVCEPQPGWKDREITQCMLGKDVAIAQLITDCLADFILIIAPVYLLSTLSMRSLRNRLLVVFSSTILTTIFSLVHAYAILKDLGYMEFMFAVIEIVVSLIVVNLSVLSSWIFGLKDDDSDSGPSAHMNTFLREQHIGRTRGHEVATIGLTTFTPAHIQITTEVDTGKGGIDGRERTVQLLSQFSEQLDDGGSVEKKFDY
ncbi:hypothetical protein K435DRAFT_938414 [Dendrothele bispora CBS 962.96]|uniref:Rhodopsin domain-containing protein n=1 Tax=Dendrothele bispora (strain CBS 962.96) TaxID=1314807 RepID=A0A4V4HDU7_DENBC|nr:hypothetical protein K435DRAFT_916961 [Dendrothele bispora CBS 962.96]THU99627.1 hypothetical protein K435DRAFT_938414 [Dendrothele bispora CBS 962.96]